MNNHHEGMKESTVLEARQFLESQDAMNFV